MHANKNVINREVMMRMSTRQADLILILTSAFLCGDWQKRKKSIEFVTFLKLKSRKMRGIRINLKSLVATDIYF